jgi:hypothetical protein
MESYNELSVKISKPNISCEHTAVSLHFHRKCTLIKVASFSVNMKKSAAYTEGHQCCTQNKNLLLHKSTWPPCWYYRRQGVKKKIMIMTFPMTWCSHHILHQLVNNTEWQMTYPSYWVLVTKGVNYWQWRGKKWPWFKFRYYSTICPEEKCEKPQTGWLVFHWDSKWSPPKYK